MNTNSVWDLLSSVSIGTVIAWATTIFAILSIICTGTIKLYKLFTKYKEMKDENEDQKKLLKKHDDVLTEVNSSLKQITASLEEQKGVNLKQIRYTIVHICEEAIVAKCISVAKLRSLEEMFEEYTDVFHGNGYVKTLVTIVRTLPVVGNIEEEFSQ